MNATIAEDWARSRQAKMAQLTHGAKGWMLMQCKFIIRGTPRGQGRPRFTTLHGYASAYKRAEDTQWEKQIRTAFLMERAASGWNEPSEKSIGINIKAVMPIPSKLKAKERHALEAEDGRSSYNTKPDTDNICKSVMDAMNGVAWKDDRQVVEIHARKIYGKVPRLVVTIWEEDDEQGRQEEGTAGHASMDAR